MQTSSEDDIDIDKAEITIPTTLSYKEILGIGVGGISFRDEATSPLIYRGLAFSFSRSTVKRSPNRESIFTFRPMLGATFSNVNSEFDLGGILSFDVLYTYLRPVKKLSFSDVSVLVGGTLDMTTVTRFNPSFQNNSVGYDFFPTLMGSVKLRKAFVGKSIFGDPFSFLEMFRFFKAKPLVHQELTFQMDVGIINTNYRNGYAYTIHAPFHNSTDVFSGHEFHWFSGFRIRSNISYLVFSNKSKNGVKLTYYWEGIRSGQNPDRLGITNGIFQFKLIHRIE